MSHFVSREKSPTLMRNKIAVFLTLTSFFCLYPGLTLPMLNLNMTGRLSSSLATFHVPILNKSSSILQTVSDLLDHKQTLVACLIFLFSVCIPILKGLLLIACYYLDKAQLTKKMMRFIKAIGKWSMADVFVVGIFLTYLSTQSAPPHSQHHVNFMGMKLNVDVTLSFLSELGSGFYWFLSYCLISLTALQLYQVNLNRSKPKN